MRLQTRLRPLRDDVQQEGPGDHRRHALQRVRIHPRYCACAFRRPHLVQFGFGKPAADHDGLGDLQLVGLRVRADAGERFHRVPAEEAGQLLVHFGGGLEVVDDWALLVMDVGELGGEIDFTLVFGQHFLGKG